MTRTSPSAKLALLHLSLFLAATLPLTAGGVPRTDAVFWPGGTDGGADRIDPEEVFEHRGRLYAAAFRRAPSRQASPGSSRLDLELLVSEDHGDRWRPVFTSPETWQLKDHRGTLTALAGGGRSLWIGVAGYGLFRSRDGGETWEEAAPADDPIALAELPDGRVVVSTRERGIWLRDAEDRAWRSLGQIVGSAFRLTAGAPDLVLASSQPSSLFRYEGGTSWARLDSPGSGSPRVIAVRSDGELFLAPYGGGLYRSSDRGETWRSLTGDVAEERGPAAGWHGIHFEPGGPVWAGISYSSGCCYRAFRSEDGEAHWQEREDRSWPVFSNREMILFRGPRGLIRQVSEDEGEKEREETGWRDVRLSCSGGGSWAPPGFIFASHSDFCARSGTEPVVVPGNLDPVVIADLFLGPGGIVWAATYEGLYSARPGEVWTRHERFGRNDSPAVTASGDAVFVGNGLGRVFRSEDGRRWQDLSEVPGAGPIRFLAVQEGGSVTAVRGDVVSRSAGSETWRLMDLPADGISALRVHGGELQVRAAERSLRFDEATSTWVDADPSALEGWVAVDAGPFTMDVPTYGRPTRIEPSFIGNFQLGALEPAGDGFYRSIPDQLSIWVGTGDPGPATAGSLEGSCEGPVSPIPGRAGAFACVPILDGDSTANAFWVFGGSGRPWTFLVESHLEPEALSRVRGSIQLRD